MPLWFNIIQVIAQVAPAIIDAVQGAADRAEARAPEGNGPQKEAFVGQVMDATIGIADALAKDDPEATPEMRSALRGFIADTTKAVVDFNNSTGRYTHQKKVEDPPFISPYENAPGKSQITLV